MTDVSNASRTMLMNIETLKWDPLLLKFFDVPRHILPEIRSSSEIFGEITNPKELSGIPITGVRTKLKRKKNNLCPLQTFFISLIKLSFNFQCIGDQQGALLGQLCLKPGQAKATYGTGCFLLYNTGSIVSIRIIKK